MRNIVWLCSLMTPFWSMQSSKTTLFLAFNLVDTMLKLPFWNMAMSLCQLRKAQNMKGKCCPVWEVGKATLLLFKAQYMNLYQIDLQMKDYPVQRAELAVYLVFSFLSLVASLVCYCLYQHCLGSADRDYSTYTQFFIDVAKIGEETHSKDNNYVHEARPSDEEPML